MKHDSTSQIQPITTDPITGDFAFTVNPFAIICCNYKFILTQIIYIVNKNFPQKLMWGFH